MIQNIILPQLPNLEGWTKQWGISAEQQRALYLQLHDALAKEGHSYVFFFVFFFCTTLY